MSAAYTSREEQVACVAREIEMRARVYPGMVAVGRMTREAAEREIALMKGVLLTLIAAPETSGGHAQ